MRRGKEGREIVGEEEERERKGKREKTEPWTLTKDFDYIKTIKNTLMSVYEQM
jgi:hypothetical protein